jgi:hypothetical protein
MSKIASNKQKLIYAVVINAWWFDLEKVLDFGYDEVGVNIISLVPIYLLGGSVAKNMLSHTAAMAKIAAITFIEGKSIRS